jgi:uncharacterized membrane protein HdeD (DUF308 family)
MLAALARNWGWLFFRAILAAAYGIAVFAWPGMTMVGFVYLFGLYAIFDGMVALERRESLRKTSRADARAL